MAEVKISQLPVAVTADYADDTVFPIVSTDATTGEQTTKQASMEGLRDEYGCGVKCASITISSAEMLALNTTPKEIVPAQGAGTVIEVISAFGKVNFTAPPYATNVDFEIITAGATTAQFGSSDFINSTINKIDRLTGTGVAVPSNTNMIENAALNAKVRAGDPTAGASDFEIHVIYRVVNI